MPNQRNRIDERTSYWNQAQQIAVQLRMLEGQYARFTPESTQCYLAELDKSMRHPPERLSSSRATPNAQRERTAKSPAAQRGGDRTC